MPLINKNKQLSSIFVFYLVLFTFFTSIIIYAKSYSPENELYATETETKELVVLAENVFVGRVIEQVGSTQTLFPTRGMNFISPYGQFTVSVEENIKGNLSGTVIVNQGGRYYLKYQWIGNDLIEVSENDKLLNLEKTYLFVTQYNEQYGWYDIAHDIVKPGYDLVLIENDQHRRQLVREFEKAYR